MRIVNRKEFLAMPKYTMYRGIGGSDFGGLSIKLESLEFNDFYYIALDDIECDGDAEFSEIIDKAKKDSSFEFKVDFEISMRDGFFDQEGFYGVYSNEEMIELGKLLLKFGGIK